MFVRLYEVPTETDYSGFTEITQTVKVKGTYIQNFYTYGSFEFSIHTDEEFASSFKIKNRIVKLDEKFWGIIKSFKYLEDDSKILVVSGFSTEHILTGRITLPADIPQADAPVGFDSFSGSTESLMKYYVRNNTHGNRNIPRLVIAASEDRGNPNDKYYSRFEIVSDLLEKVGTKANLGWHLYPNSAATNFYFNVDEGVDRTVENAIVPIIFSAKTGTMLKYEYIFDSSSSKNVYYCTRNGAEFEDEAFTQTYWDGKEPTGVERQETHIDISISNDSSQYEEMEENARAEMKNFVDTETHTADVVPDTNLVYRVDYGVGDYITVIPKWPSERLTAQIISVEVSDTDINQKYKLTLGNFRRNKFDVITRRM